MKIIVFFMLALFLYSCTKNKQENKAAELPDTSQQQPATAQNIVENQPQIKVKEESSDSEQNIVIHECKYYRDYDGDGFGEEKEKLLLPCSSAIPKGFVDKNGDCNDRRPYENPAMKETCNNVDDNCDGRIDEENAEGCRNYYFDEDNDGSGISTKSKCLCGSEEKFRAMDPNDCDDNNEKINPEAKEICNTIDDNCNGQVDEGENAKGCTPFYFDGDGDGYGIAENSKCLCLPFSSYRAKSGADCNDNNPAVYPGAPEIHDSIDNNCNGRVDEASVIIRKDTGISE